MREYLAMSLQHLPVTTLCRHMRQYGVRRYKAMTNRFTGVQMRNRVKWHRSHMRHDWNNVIFSDEMSVKLRKSLRGGCLYIYMRRGERLVLTNTVRITHVQIEVAVWLWGCLSVRRFGIIRCVCTTMNALGYLGTLQSYLLSSITLLDANMADPSFRFQQDNAPIHRAHMVRNWLEE